MTWHNKCCRSGTLWETAFTIPHLMKQRKSCRKVCSLCHCQDPQHMVVLAHPSAKDLCMQHIGINERAGLLHIHLSLCSDG